MNNIVSTLDDLQSTELLQNEDWQQNVFWPSTLPSTQLSEHPLEITPETDLIFLM